ncbi:protein lifeguard 1-like [Branchiostoma lanceolatum]|uniref:protein lifeguard 1-like n=1 Tax=Branchiostoma lanceolatum TaxID=7740 RepID=UPI00345669DB
MRKVFSILMVQLVVTIGIICIFLYVDEVRIFAFQNRWMYYVALGITFVMIITLACCPNVRRNFPINFICLAIFTLAEGYLLGSISAAYGADAVMWAAGITAVVSLSLTVFALQTKIDFTVMGGCLFVFLIVLLCFGILCAIIRNHYANIAYASLGALLFAFFQYLVYDIQLMMGGKHKYSISPEEYIFAALNLYLDIVNMFIYILYLVGAVKN